MTLRPVTDLSSSSEPDERFYALIEAKPKIGDEKIVEVLEDLRATDISILTRGFVSAKIRRSDLVEVERFGVVNFKAKSQIPFKGLRKR